LRTRISVMVMALALVLVAVGCGGSGGGGGGESGSSSDVRPGLVLDVGGLGDDGFNDSAYAGLKRAEKDFGVKGD
jgi:basic membrane protein A and related proteins